MNDEQRKLLLDFARQRLAYELLAGPEPDEPELGGLIDHSGAFVTLRNGGRLRGCMGTFVAKPSVADTLVDAIRSAARDPRFADEPIGPMELKLIRIEISLLGPRRRMRSSAELQVGLHGILIRHGHGSGCFLPEVAVDRQWSAEQFLSECCRMKAKLAPEAWRDPEADVCIFETEHFAETV